MLFTDIVVLLSRPKDIRSPQQKVYYYTA